VSLADVMVKPQCKHDESCKKEEEKNTTLAVSWINVALSSYRNHQDVDEIRTKHQWRSDFTLFETHQTNDCKLSNDHAHEQDFYETHPNHTSTVTSVGVNINKLV
jgi:hypothetical protein